jgi:hypothetical protein
MRLFIYAILCIGLVCGCSDRPQAPRNINYQIVKQEPFSNDHRFVRIYITVDNSATKEEIYAISIKLLNEGWQRRTETGKPPANVSIKTFYKGDTSLSNEIGWVIQADPVQGRIAYTYLGVTAYDREIAEPTLSRAEKERQEEIGKFAGELLKEAERIRNNR